jgi:hypothetical protein
MGDEKILSENESEGEGTPPANETREQRFIRLANARVNKAIYHIRLIGNLTSASYESTPIQRKAIIDTLRKVFAEVEYHFGGTPVEDKNAFKLSEPIKPE